MSNNTNTLFWVITGAVVVLSVFLLIKNNEEDSLNRINDKFNNVAQNYDIAGFSTTTDPRKFIFLKVPNQASVDDLKTWLVGTKIVCPLATPTELTTSPVALNARNGTNNVWSDCGQTSLKYYDIHSYSIDGLFETNTPNLSLTQNSINATDFIET